MKHCLEEIFLIKDSRTKAYSMFHVVKMINRVTTGVLHKSILLAPVVQEVACIIRHFSKKLKTVVERIVEFKR